MSVLLEGRPPSVPGTATRGEVVCDLSRPSLGVRDLRPRASPAVGTERMLAALEEMVPMVKQHEGIEISARHF